jgi:hypothetical protein
VTVSVVGTKLAISVVSMCLQAAMVFQWMYRIVECLTAGVYRSLLRPLFVSQYCRQI